MEKRLVRKIGLVAHDAMKRDLIEWVLWNSELLMGHKFYCTGTTGTLILEALKEKHPDVRWGVTNRWDHVLWMGKLTICFSLPIQ